LEFYWAFFGHVNYFWKYKKHNLLLRVLLIIKLFKCCLVIYDIFWFKNMVENWDI